MKKHPFEEHQNNSFTSAIVASCLFHIAVVSIFIVKTTFFPSEDLIIASAIRVDMIGLPDKAKPKPKLVAKKKSVKKAAKKKSKPVKKTTKKSFKKIKSAQQRAFEKLNALNALEKIESDINSKEVEEQTTEKKQEFKGNKITDGSNLEGLTKVDFNRYYESMSSKVRNNWSLPQWLADANLKAQAVIFLDENGALIKAKILQSSGNSIFDETVLNALSKASPFGEPPVRLKSILRDSGIVFRFPAE